MKKQLIYKTILGLVFFSVFFFSLDHKLDLNGDNVTYLELARNLSNGHGYSQMTLTGELSPASHFPPGYAFLLSVFMFLGIGSVMFFKILNGVLLFASLLLIYAIVKKATRNESLSFSAAFMAIFVPQLLHFSGIVMSEMLFLFLTVFSLFSLYKYAETKQPFLKSPWFYGAIVAMMAAYHVRTVAMAGMLAILAFFLFRKEWKQTGVALVSMVLLMVPWAIRNSIYGIKSRYMGTVMTVNPWRPEEGSVSSVGEMIDKMIQNFDETVIKGFQELLFPFLSIDYGTPSGIFSIIMGLLVVAVIVYGAWNLKEIKWATLVFIAGNIGLFMLWHGGNGSRYVVPICPILIACFFVGIYSFIANVVFRKKEAKTSMLLKALPFLFFLLIIPSWKPIKTQAEIAKRPYPPAYTNYFNILKEMQKHLPEGTICSCRKPEFVPYYAPNIRTTRYLYSTNPEEVIKDLINKKVEFVILEQLGYSSTPRYLYPAIAKYQSLFPVVIHLQTPDTYLLRFEREKAKQLLPD